MYERWDEDPDKWEKQPWVCYDLALEEDAVMWVVRRCPHCGRYVSNGKVLTNMEGSINFDGWKCKAHGDVSPFFVWDE